MYFRYIYVIKIIKLFFLKTLFQVDLTFSFLNRNKFSFIYIYIYDLEKSVNKRR